MQDCLLQCDQAKNKREQKRDLPKMSLKSQADLPEAALQDALSHPETLGTQNSLPHVRPHPVSFPLPCCDAWRKHTFSMALQESPAALGTSLLCCTASWHVSVQDWIKYGSECMLTCLVRQLKEMQTDPPEERKETLPSFFQLYPGPRSVTSSLLHCSILSHKTQRERECDKDESDVASSYVKTITLQLSVIDFPNQRCIQLPTDRYERRPDAGEFSTRAWARTSQGNKMEML